MFSAHDCGGRLRNRGYQGRPMSRGVVQSQVPWKQSQGGRAKLCKKISNPRTSVPHAGLHGGDS